jgi:hypothetical protein
MKFWQYIVASIIGACLGFALQYVIDNGGESWVVIRADYPSNLEQYGIEGSKPYNWTYTLEGKSLGTPYRLENGELFYPGVPEDVEKWSIPAKRWTEWKTLWYQLRFLNWLQVKGEVILRAVSLGGMILPFICFCIFNAKKVGWKKD